MNAEELTAEERVSLTTDWPPHYETLAKLMRLYDVALARAEAAEQEEKIARRLRLVELDRALAAESALAEAAALLKRAQAWFAWPTPSEPGPEPAVCLLNAIEAFLALSRIPAPAAKAER